MKDADNLAARILEPHIASIEPQNRGLVLILIQKGIRTALEGKEDRPMIELAKREAGRWA